jgi:hypothetical protein
MSESDSSDSEHSLPPPETVAISASVEAAPLPPTSTLEPDFSQPCRFHPSCLEQCPGFTPMVLEPMRCICKHLGSLHHSRREDSQAGTSALLPPSQEPHWLNWVHQIKKERDDAQAEVNSGYSGSKQNKGKGRAVSSPVITQSSKVASSMLPECQKNMHKPALKPAPKRKSAAKDLDLEPIHGIYFVENAHKYVSKVCFV